MYCFLSVLSFSICCYNFIIPPPPPVKGKSGSSSMRLRITSMCMCVCVIGVVSTWLRQCVPCWSAWSWVEQTSVNPECCSTAHILREEARSCSTTTAWSPLAAGATAYWIQDCCACLPVSSRTSSGVYVFPATKCEGFTIKATTMIVVIALPTCAYIATVNCWRSCFSSCCRTSLESLSLSLSLSRGVISASALPAFKCRLKTELFLRSFPEVAPTASD